jgi:hypothetical protein
MNSKPILPLFVAISLTAAFCLPSAAAAEGTFKRALQVTGPVIIDLSTDTGSVNVRSGNSDEVVVTGWVRVTNWFGGDALQVEKTIADNPPIQQGGNEIRIGHLAKAGLLHSVSINYDLIVPAGTSFRSHSGSSNQNLAAASAAAVFLMLIVNVVVFRRTYRSASRTA